MSSTAPATPELIAPDGAPSLTKRTAQGAVWTIFFAGLNKVVAFGSQVALAWFLLPGEMGLFATAMSVAGVASILSGANLRNILIQKERCDDETVSQVFWLSLVLNIVAALVVAMFAPFAGRLFREASLVPLILLLALTVPFLALPTVYSAFLYRELRFRTIARIQFIEGLIRNGGAVIMAASGCGASSLILPMFISAIFAWASCRMIHGPIAIGNPAPTAWPGLLKPASWLLLLALLNAVQAYGTNFVIGLEQDSIVTGLYYWGYSISSQATFVLAANLQNVFFPVLSRFNQDPAQQRIKYLQLCRTLLLVIGPVAILQIVLARPIIGLIFHDRWQSAVPVVQWLSLGMVTQPLSVAATALLLARGQFRILAGTMGIVAASGIAAAAIGAALGEQGEIARWTGTTLFFANVFAASVALRQVSAHSAQHLQESLVALKGATGQ